ncbi:hypothetical protein ACIQBJ_21030 [Kitasatospora sp. NPDC088391]|uniref:hypothetical protein n=1 Tax=Kitasatospora sp. NPDC088391 TaxID=3364074 RepID=UPI0038214D83
MTIDTSSALALARPAGPEPGPEPGSRTARQPQNCAVIGPIEEPRPEAAPPDRPALPEVLSAFELIVEPACARLGIEPMRSDRIFRSDEITAQACEELLAADLLIVDVSGGSPDVMYGLGLWRATGKPVVHIGETGQLPFDIVPFPTIVFRCSPVGMAEARNELAEALSRVLRGGVDRPARARVLHPPTGPGGHGSAARGPGGGSDSPEGSPSGLVEQFTELAPGLTATSDHISEIITLVTDVAAAAEEFGPGVRRAARSGSPMSVQLAFTERLSAALSEPASELRKSARRLAVQMAGIDTSVQAALDLFERVPPAHWSAEDREFLGQLVDISTAARHGAETLTLFRAVMDVMIAVHHELRGPARDIATAVAELGGSMAVLEAWDRRAGRLTA